MRNALKLCGMRRRFCSVMPNKIRNVAIIAHVDHGKTTLVDKLLQETKFMGRESGERIMDSGTLEKERGITILSKCTSVLYKDHVINLIDTPGHSDFGGEVERILRMVDGVLLVVDVAEGPKPQTSFVLKKSLRKNLSSILVINKVDRQRDRVDDAEMEILSLYDELKASEKQMDFPVIYASARDGWAVKSLEEEEGEKETQSKSMKPLLETIISEIPSPNVSIKEKFSFLVTMIGHDSHLGKIVTGRISSGRVNIGDKLKTMNREGKMVETGTVSRILVRRGIKQEPMESAVAGDIVSIAGFPTATVTDTISHLDVDTPLESDIIDPPTLEIRVGVNTSPLQGKEGKKLTSAQIGERLMKEAMTNVAIKVKAMKDGNTFSLNGRGELQMGILLETMRREGYEMEVSPPTILTRKNDDGILEEPFEKLTIEVDECYIGRIIEAMALKKAEMVDMNSIEGTDKTCICFRTSSRSLLGINGLIKNLSRGTALLQREFDGFSSHQGPISSSRKGCIISMTDGVSTPFALYNLESKGKLFISPNAKVYNGMIIGETNSEKDVEVSPVKAKKQSNIRTNSTDDNIRLIPPVKMHLEEAISYINPDELVEITPMAIRIRKMELNSAARNKIRRQNKK